MKSIRLALLVYFLVLLGLALGAASVLAYRNAQGVLDEKEEARRQLLQKQYTDACERERHRLDRVLSSQARAFGMVAGRQFHMNRERSVSVFPLLGVFSASMDRNGLVTAPLWFSRSRSLGPWGEMLHRGVVTEIQFNEDDLDLPPFPDPQVTEYLQINSEFRSWRSRSLGDRSLPFDRAALKEMKMHDYVSDEIELEPGLRVRLLKWKATTLWVWSFAQGRPGHADRGRPGSRDQTRRNAAPFWPRPWEQPAPAILMQIGADTKQRDLALTRLKDELDENLANLAAESEATLADLRNRLLLIASITFAATVAGGIWLVRLGLSPLRRLSQAVSLVSVKDFRLPFDDRNLPKELRPIVERLSETLALLKRAFAREKQAAADISHELRTPLSALLTTIDVALRKPRSPEEYRELLSDCHATGLQMSQLVERLLALARLDAGVDTLRPRTVDVTNLAEQCMAMVRPLAEVRGLSLNLHGNGPIHVTTDADKLREIMTNLLHNAIEYNRPKGSVDFTVQQANGHLEVEVRDTGVGIKPEAREHIFERFYRADPSRQAEGLHAGLGLAIVKGYVDLMGGTITVDSISGSGSTFRLRLPIHKLTPGSDFAIAESRNLHASGYSGSQA
jgi:two-component system, OmpR family, heavy metal sensor histidine kinase CusS